jgi:hypothetical protein
VHVAGSSQHVHRGKVVLPKIIDPHDPRTDQQNSDSSSSKSVSRLGTDSVNGTIEQPVHFERKAGLDQSSGLPDSGNEGPQKATPVQKSELIKPSIWKRFGSMPGRVNPTASADDDGEVPAKGRVRDIVADCYRSQLKLLCLSAAAESSL